MFMLLFARRGCGESSTASRPLSLVDPPPKGETWVMFPGDEELFGVPKAAVWWTRKQAKKFLEKKRKEREAGEERQGDDDEDADAEDADGDGDGDGDEGDQGDGPRVRVHRGLTGMRVWGWRTPGWRVKGWWVTGWWSVRVKGGQVPGRLAPRRPRKRSSLGTYKETNPMCPAQHPNLQCMFHIPFIHTLLFVSLVCSGGVLAPCSGGVPVVFRQNVFLNAKFFAQQHGL